MGRSRTSLLALLFFLSFLPSARGNSSVNIPLDSWVYPALEKLESYGLIRSLLSGARPYTRLEAARLAAEAMKRWEAMPPQTSSFAGKELIPKLLQRLRRELRLELIDRGDLAGAPAATYIKPVDQVILKTVYQTDAPVVRPQLGPPATETVYPVYNNDGIVYRKGNNFTSELEGEGRIWNHLSFYYRPIFLVREGEDAQVRLEKGYLKAEALNLELEVGRDSLWWGPGHHGALIMTRNARPFDLIKLSNSYPFILPVLGAFKFNLFLSRLDPEQPFIARPLLYGLRLDLKPHPVLELGVSHMAIFEGEGRKDLSVAEVFRILYSNTSRDNTKLESNQQLALDLALRWPHMDRFLPLAKSLKIYGEMGAEDRGVLPDRRSYLVGLALYDLFLTGRADVRLEYANTSPHSEPSAWYTHGAYPPLFHGRIFGHPAGSNADDLYARLAGYITSSLTLGVYFDLMKQGIRQNPETRSYQYGADFAWLLSERSSIQGMYLYEVFQDRSGIAGGNAHHQIALLEFRWKH